MNNDSIYATIQPNRIRILGRLNMYTIAFFETAGGVSKVQKDVIVLKTLNDYKMDIRSVDLVIAENISPTINSMVE